MQESVRSRSAWAGSFVSVSTERAERGLAVRREVLLDGAADALLDLVVGVDGAGAEHARGGTRGGRLARAHEADEDEGYLRGFHPMRRS